MAECQMITHEIVRGDTLYRLAQKYRTTVPLILLANPGVDPYNLQVGTRLNICKGNQMSERPSMDEIQMMGDFDKRMMQYIGWLKVYLLALAGSAARQREAAQKAEAAAGNIVDVFAVFYPEAMITRLREHFARGYTLDLMSYANAINNRDTQAAEQFEERVSDHAENMAELLAQYNRYYDSERIEEALDELPEYLQQVVLAMRGADDMAEFTGFNRMDDWAGNIATYLAEGLRREFYRER